MFVRTSAFGFALLGAVVIPAQAETVTIAHPALGSLIAEKNGETVGFVADVIRAAAAHENITVVFVPLSQSVAKTLATGTVDAVAPMLETPEGRQTYDFTATLVASGGGLFVRAPNPAPSDLAALSSKTVVSPNFGPFVSYIEKNFPAVKVVPTASYVESLDRVLSGQADAAALNIREGAEVVASSYAGKISVPSAPFVRESLVLAVLKGQHADIISRLNAGLAAIRADGTLQKILKQWSADDAAP